MTPLLAGESPRAQATAVNKTLPAEKKEPEDSSFGLTRGAASPALAIASFPVIQAGAHYPHTSSDGDGLCGAKPFFLGGVLGGGWN